MTQSARGTGSERPEGDPDFETQFARLVEEVERGRRTVAEPDRGQGGRKTTRRVWPRNLAVAVIAGALAVGAAVFLRHGGLPGMHGSGVHDAAVAGSGTASAKAGESGKGGEGGSATASSATAELAGAESAGAGSADAAGVSQIAVSELFPQTVRGTNGTVYTLVTAGALNNCVNSDMVGPTLAGLFVQSKGCVGGEGALYKDAAKDQFNMTVFTLKDPVDAASIVTDLSMSPSDFEVGVLAPPAGSGLLTLPATSGIIQQFASSGHYMGVFMAQWSDGRAADYSSLQKLLTPLQNAVSGTMSNER